MHVLYKYICYKSVYCCPLNNTGWSCMGLLIHRSFSNSKYYSTT